MKNWTKITLFPATSSLGFEMMLKWVTLIKVQCTLARKREKLNQGKEIMRVRLDLL